MAMAGLASAGLAWRRGMFGFRACNSRMAVVVNMARRNGAARVKIQQSKRKTSAPKRNVHQEARPDDNDSDEDEKEAKLEEDALEALFSQLEKDLEAADERNDPFMTEAEMIAFEKELGIGMPDKKKDKVKKVPKKDRDEVPLVDVTVPSDDDGNELSSAEDTRSGLQKFIEQAEMIESERVSRRIVKLEKRQLLKLKAALDLKKGKVKVKALAEETGLDRRDVLTFLRNPPAELLEMVDSLSESEEEPEEKEQVEAEVKAEPEAVEKPAVERIGGLGDSNQIHGTGPQSWYSRKRIRKQHLDTFELVFERSKRPTGAMIQSMVDITGVPRKRILDWFENRRREHGLRVEEHKMRCRESLKQKKVTSSQPIEHHDLENKTLLN